MTNYKYISFTNSVLFDTAQASCQKSKTGLVACIQSALPEIKITMLIKLILNTDPGHSAKQVRVIFADKRFVFLGKSAIFWHIISVQNRMITYRLN